MQIEQQGSRLSKRPIIAAIVLGAIALFIVVAPMYDILTDFAGSNNHAESAIGMAFYIGEGATPCGGGLSAIGLLIVLVRAAKILHRRRAGAPAAGVPWLLLIAAIINSGALIGLYVLWHLHV